jgi:transcriptional regulator with XRE-family HTH domain
MKKDILDIIAKNIKTLRLDKDLSQEELADKANLHRTYISLLERKKKNVSIKILEKIANALEVEISDLIKP